MVSPGPEHKSGCQKIKEKKKRELLRALDPNSYLSFQSVQKAATKRAKKTKTDRMLTLQQTLQEVVSISERATTTCQKGDDVEKRKLKV